MAFSLKEYRKQKQQSQQSTAASSEMASTTQQTKPFSLAEYRKQKRLASSYYDNDPLKIKQEAEYKDLNDSLGYIDTTDNHALLEAKQQALRSKNFFNTNDFLYGDLTDTNSYLDDLVGNIDTAMTANNDYQKQYKEWERRQQAAKKVATGQSMPLAAPSIDKIKMIGMENEYEAKQKRNANPLNVAKDYFSNEDNDKSFLETVIDTYWPSTGNPKKQDVTEVYPLKGMEAIEEGNAARKYPYNDYTSVAGYEASRSPKNPLYQAENATPEMLIGEEQINGKSIQSYTYMSDAEKDYYNRLYGSQGPEAAEDFHNMLLDSINYRIANDQYNKVWDSPEDENKALQAVKGTGKLIASFGNQAANSIRGEARDVALGIIGSDNSYVPNTGDYVASLMREDTGNSPVFNTMLDLASSLGYMSPHIAVGTMTGGASMLSDGARSTLAAAGVPTWMVETMGEALTYSGVSQSLATAGTAYREAINNGESVGTARKYGTFMFFDEFATNALLNGMGGLQTGAITKLFGEAGTEALTKVLDEMGASPAVKELALWATDRLSHVGGEMAQEWVQEFTESWYKAILNMRDEEGNPVVANTDIKSKDAAYAAILGGLNVVLMDVLGGISSTFMHSSSLNAPSMDTVNASDIPSQETVSKLRATTAAIDQATARQGTQAPELTEQNTAPVDQKTTAIELAAQMNGVSPEEITQNVPEAQLPEGTQSVQITDSAGNVSDALQTQATADVVAETADVLPETADEARTLNEEIQPQTIAEAVQPQTIAEAVQPQTASEAQPQTVQTERTYSPEAQALATEMGISEEAADTILQMERSNESTAEASQTQATAQTENVTPATAEAATSENSEAVKLSNIKARSSQFPERASKVYNDNYDGGDVVDYDEHMKRAYTAGFNGTPMNDIYDDYYVEHAEAMEAMWRAGSVEHIASTTPAATTAVNAAQIAPDATATATSATPTATNVASAATNSAPAATADITANTTTTTTQKKGKDINDLRKISQEKKAAKRRNEVTALSEDYGESEAKAFAENYDPSIAPSEYQDAWDAAVEAGRAHASFDEIDASIMDKLGATTYAIAYNMGSDESYETAQRYSRSTEAEDRTSTKENKQETKTDVKSGLVRDANFKKANLTSTQAKVLDYIGKAIGSPVRFVEELYDDTGKAVNGTYDNGDILIALNTNDPFMTTFMHETIHRLKKANPKAYSELRNFVKEAMGDDYFSALVDVWGQEYKGDTDYVSEEVVADAMGYVFGDEEGMRRFVESHRELARTLSDVLHDVIRTINNYIKGIDKTGGELTQRQRDVMQPVFERMDEAISLIDAAIKETAEEANEVYHSYAKGLPDAIDEILDGKKKRDNVRLRDFTPVSLVNRGIPDEPMFMKASHMAENILTEEEAKKKGFPVNDKTHYHGLGKELFLKALDAMDGKIEVYRWKTNPDNSYGENDYIVITELTDATGNTIIVPIVINSRAKENNIMIDVNEVKTVYGKTDLKKYLSKYTNAHYLSRVKEKQASSSGVSGGVQFPATMQTKSPVDGSVADGKKNNNSRSRARYSYAGVNAATADVKTLAEAEKLLTQGEDSEAVRQKTGWFKGMDGKWRFELDDSQIKFWNISDKMVYAQHKLESLISAPELFKAYPSLKNMPVTLKYMEGRGELGTYHPASKTIDISAELSGNRFKATLIHEIQHAIQDLEGFTAGSSPFYWATEDAKTGYSLTDRLHEKKMSILRSLPQEDMLKYSRYSEVRFALDDAIKRANAEGENVDWSKLEKYDAESDKLYKELYPNKWFKDLLDIELELGNPEFIYNKLYRNTAGEIEARDTASRRNLTASERRATAPNLGDENTVFVEGDAGASNSIAEPFTDEDGNKYESAVLLDTDFFDGISPRNWMRKLKQYVESRAENSPFIMVVQDESGDSQSLQFAKKQDRVEKNGNTHPVLSELYRAKDNISKLAVIHIDEIVEISEENNPYYTSDNSHGWLDKHGWLHRNANVINAKTGDIYNLTFDIAKAADGRIILYATKGKIQKVGNAKVHSLKIRGAKQNSNLTDSLTQNNENSNNQKRFSKSVDLDEADMERLENIRKANSHIRYMNDVFDATVTAVTGKSTRTGSAQRAVDFAIKTYSSTADGAELTNTLQTVYDYLSASSKADAQEVYAVVHSIAEDIVNGAQTKNTDMNQQYPGLRKQLRTTRLNVSDTIRKSIPDYNDFRKANMGALKLAKTGGIEVDSFYEELSTQYPELFPAEIANDTDRLLQISEIAGLLKPQMVDGIVYDGGVMTAEEMEVETAALTQKLMNGFFGSMNTVDNTPKYEATIKALKTEHETELTKKQAEVEWYKHAYQEWKANTKSWYSKAYQQWKGNTKDWYSKAYKDWKQRYVERNDINSAKKRIISDVKALTRMLEHPTDSKHVPDFLRTDLANFLSKIDFSSDYVHPSGDLTQRTLDWQKLQNTLGGILNSQANAIQTGEGTVYMDIDPDIVAKMKELNKAVESGKRLNDMTKDEIKNLRETMIAMKKCIESANKLVTSKKNETVQSRGDATIQQLAKHKNRINSTNAILRTFDKLFTDDMLDSDARFYTMGKAAYECYKSLREGLNTKIFDIQSVSRYFEQIRKENNVTRADMDSWASGKIINEVQLDSGKKIKFTPAIAMNLYALSKREQAMGHLLGEGIVIAPFKDGNKYVEQGLVQLTEGDIGKITGTLSKEQKAVQNAISANYKVCSAWGNEASMQMYGYEKFTAEDYTAPIETDKDFIPTNTKDVIGNYDIIKNYGFTKSTVEGARNPIRVRSTFDVYVDHINKMSNYHAFLAPLSDVQKWFNYRAEDGSGSVRLSIKNALGNDANQYILKLMRNINGFKVDDTYFAKPLISLYKGSAVGFNISVAVQQPTSYLRAIAVVPKEYLLKGLAPTKLKVGTFEDIKNYSAIAQWKDWGFFETDVGRSLKSILLGGRTGLQSLNDKQMWLAGKGDEVAWTAMWRACEAWVEDTNKSVEVGSDEYFKKVAEKFDMIIDKTQVVDSPLHRAEIMRSSSELNQIATSFMSEPMKSYNTLYRTLYDVKNPEVNGKTKAETQKAATAAFTGWITANVLAAAAKSLITALRDDDKDKEYWDRWNESFIEEALGNLNPLGYIPWVKDIYSILEGYDSSRMDLQIGNDLNYLISRWKKRFSGDSPYTIASDIVYSLRIVSRATGIGFNSLQRDVNAIIDEAISMIGADEVAYQKAKTFKYDIGNSSNLKYYTSMALKAYVNGNKALGDKIVKDMKDAGIDEEKLDAKMKSIMKDNPDMAKQVHEAGGEVGLIAAQAQYSSRVSAEGASKKAEKVDILLDMAGDGDITEDELSTIYEDSWGTENFTDWKQAGGSTTDYIEYAIEIPNLKVKGNTTNENKEAVIDYIHDQHISKESATILWELAGYTAERDFDEWYNK